MLPKPRGEIGQVADALEVMVFGAGFWMQAPGHGDAAKEVIEDCRTHAAAQALAEPIQRGAHDRQSLARSLPLAISAVQALRRGRDLASPRQANRMALQHFVTAWPHCLAAVVPSWGMPQGLVLVIENDEWISRLLAAGIRDCHYEVAVCTTAEEGLTIAAEREPDCIICSVNLPDSDGFSVAQRVRTQPSRVSVTPFLFLSELDDQASRLQGFHVGADVYMTKPFRVGDVVAQVRALVQMAARLREHLSTMISSPPEHAAAISGDLSQLSIATVLTLLEMERRSGTFEVVSKKRRAQLELASGFVLGGTVGGTKVSALAGLRTMLGWNVGRFFFEPSAPKSPPAEEKSLSAFLMEAMRLEDEAARAELDLPPCTLRRSQEHKLAVPALGGPPSCLEDFAPPSSRAPQPVFMEPTVPLDLDTIHLESGVPPSRRTRPSGRAGHTSPPSSWRGAARRPAHDGGALDRSDLLQSSLKLPPTTSRPALSPPPLHPRPHATADPLVPPTPLPGSRVPPPAPPMRVRSYADAPPSAPARKPTGGPRAPDGPSAGLVAPTRPPRPNVPRPPKK